MRLCNHYFLNPHAKSANVGKGHSIRGIGDGQGFEHHVRCQTRYTTKGRSTPDEAYDGQ